jgi:hypothetical protein
MFWSISLSDYNPNIQLTTNPLENAPSLKSHHPRILIPSLVTQENEVWSGALVKAIEVIVT